MPGIYDAELDELYRRRREDDLKARIAQRERQLAELQSLWEASEALADAHESELRASGLPLPGEPGARTPGELPRGYLAEKRATFEQVGATYPATIEIPLWEGTD